MNTDLMFSSKTDDWATPQDFYDKLNEEFHFNLDVCATQQNTKCEKFYTIEDDGLKQPWIGNIWCNPPYGKTISQWCKKAQEEIKKDANVIVLLVHARTDTRWFHDYIYNKPNVEIRFVKGRLKFGGSNNSAPFPSMLAIFKKGENSIEKN